MPLQFLHFCDLLAHLHSYSSRQPPLTNDRRESLYQQTITQWLHVYKVSVDSTDIDAVIILSGLLPARRTDRVYFLQAPSLSRKLRRYLHLGEGRWQQLDQWKTPGRGDLGDCVERLQAQTEVPTPLPGHEVTVEEVDRTLELIAKACRFSAPSVRENGSSVTASDVDNALEHIYHRLQSRDAKWFTRMILKDYAGLELKERMVFKCLDSRLPAMIKNQDNFQSAVQSLRKPENETIAVQRATESVSDLAGPLPKIGAKVGRTTYLKGRSIKHAMSMIDGREMSAERKYDGEYFQIHVDLTKDKWLQVFSKSGKDSTRDREGIQGIVKDSLRIGHKNCGFSRNCILEGEMVVWSDETNEILDFHKIRKHISRSGSFIGTVFDSQPHEMEHLMLIYYDIMLLDDNPVLKKPYTWRRGLLEKIVRRVKGRAKVATRRGLHLEPPNGPERLVRALAQAFVNGWEGLVLKPSDEPYFNDYNKRSSHKYTSCWIKLKKDYIAGLGDTADFAIFGAGYDSAEAVKLGNPNFKWTHFHLGCLRNKQDVLAKGAKPEVTIFVAINQCIKLEDVKRLNEVGHLREMKPGSEEVAELFVLNIQPGVPKMTVVFKKPFVFEVLGSGFDKAPNQGFFTLRFPRVLKVRWDRNWKESVAFDELQQMAEEARMAPSGDVRKDVRKWMEKLDIADQSKYGRMESLEDSQEGLSIVKSSEPNVTRGRRLAATPLVRTDTSEMIPGNSRLSNGEISEQMPQKGTTCESGRAQPAPPSSPSEQLFNDLKSVQDPIVGQSLNRKRKAGIEIAETSEEVKKSRKESFSVSSTEIMNIDSETTDDSQNNPLQNITNSARPRDTLSIKSSKTSLHANFSLVPKLKVGARSRKTAKARKSDEISSSQCTTDRGSESTPRTNVTSQNVATQSPSPGFDSPTQRANPPETIDLSEHDTPTQRAVLPTTTNSIEHDKPTQRTNLPPATNPISPPSYHPIQIPNLQQSGAILSPCIAPIPYIIEDLLTSPPIPTSLIPTSLTLPIQPPPNILPPFSQTPIILIEPGRKTPTVDLMEHLVSTMAATPFAEIQLWDWRLLESLRKGVEDEGYMEKVRRKRFFARIRWVWEGEGGEGIMRIEWGDGRVSPVPRKFGVRERKKKGLGGER